MFVCLTKIRAQIRFPEKGIPSTNPELPMDPPELLSFNTEIFQNVYHRWIIGIMFIHKILHERGQTIMMRNLRPNGPGQGGRLAVKIQSWSSHGDESDADAPVTWLLLANEV